MLLISFFLSLIIVGVLMILYAIFFEIKQNKYSRNIGDNKHSVDILKERFAKGEISRDEFLKDRELLSGK